MSALALLVLFGISSDLPSQTTEHPREVVTVQMVVNTNTVVVRTADDPMLWVTLLGVGTPETIDARKPNYLLGKPDPNWLASWLLPGAKALMERRGVSVSGRPLVLLFRLADQYCWNAYLVRAGAAFAAQQIDFPEFSKLASLEETAQRRRSGLWRVYRAPSEPKAPLEPYELAATRERHSTEPHGLDPAIFPPHHRKRYASQTDARAQNAEMLSAMMGQYQDTGPQLNYMNAGSYLLGGSRVFGSVGPGSHRCGKPTSTTGGPCQRLVANGNACPFHGY